MMCARDRGEIIGGELGLVPTSDVASKLDRNMQNNELEKKTAIHI